MATVSVSVSIPSEVKEEMAAFPETNWSAVARRAFEDQMKRMRDLKRLNELTANVEVTDEEIEALGKKIKHGITKWHDEQARKRRRGH